MKHRVRTSSLVLAAAALTLSVAGTAHARPEGRPTAPSNPPVLNDSGQVRIPRAVQRMMDRMRSEMRRVVSQAERDLKSEAESQVDALVELADSGVDEADLMDAAVAAYDQLDDVSAEWAQRLETVAAKYRTFLERRGLLERLGPRVDQALDRAGNKLERGTDKAYKVLDDAIEEWLNPDDDDSGDDCDDDDSGSDGPGDGPGQS